MIKPVLNKHAWFSSLREYNSSLQNRGSPTDFSGAAISIFKLKLGIWVFKAKSLRESELKVFAGGGMPKMTIEIYVARNFGWELWD